ncbi:hypothetical protein OK016_17420 [Vibrio chagasii]|nr:hypothetical protein [Vibrio chagasii]
MFVSGIGDGNLGIQFLNDQNGCDQRAHPLLATAARFSLAVIPVIFLSQRPNVAWRYLVGYGFRIWCSVGGWLHGQSLQGSHPGCRQYCFLPTY